MATITIQPATLPDLTRPYPWHIDTATGDVGRQEFWKGDPYRLMGFQKASDSVQRVTVFLEDFTATPDKAIDMQPVFIRADGSMYSSSHTIETVTVQP